MNRSIRLAIAALAVGTLMGCAGQGGGGAAPTTPAGTATTSPAAPSSAAPVPSAEDLAGYLVSPADLPGWVLWEGFEDWPGGRPGVVPDDQRELLPALDLCPNAGDEALALAEDLRWQAFTQLHQETDKPFDTMVVAQQLLLADRPDRTAQTFTTLRDGLERCLTENLPAGDWEIGRAERLEVPAVGEDRYAERTSWFDAEARRETRLMLVEDGAVLMAVRIDEVLINPDAEAALSQETVNAVVTAMADKLP